ncbi:hypothetical protein [Actinotalea ferrariae]|nr:hypothetical protein [Actinotalea ferrariae]
MTAPEDYTRQQAADPATPQQVLADIAALREDLRPVVALNPSAYPGLLDWLASLGEPGVDTALRERRERDASGTEPDAARVEPDAPWAEPGDLTGAARPGTWATDVPPGGVVAPPFGAPTTPFGASTAPPFGAPGSPPPFGAPSTTGPTSSAPPFGGAPYGSAPYGSAPYGSAPPGSAPYASAPYGSAPAYGSAPYGGAGYGGVPLGVPVPKRGRTGLWIVLAVVGGVVVLGVVAVAFLVQTLRSAPDVLEDSGLGGGTYGDDSVLDALWDRCADEDWTACDDLYWAADLGSEYEDFGETCGGRTDGWQPSCVEWAGGTGVAGDPTTYGDDPTLDALWDDCQGEDWGACDELFRVSPVGSEYEAFGDTCGYRTAGEEWCVDELG